MGRSIPVQIFMLASQTERFWCLAAVLTLLACTKKTSNANAASRTTVYRELSLSTKSSSSADRRWEAFDTIPTILFMSHVWLTTKSFHNQRSIFTSLARCRIPVEPA